MYEKIICVSKCKFVIKSRYRGLVVQERVLMANLIDKVSVQNLLASFHYKFDLDFSHFRNNCNNATLVHLKHKLLTRQLSRQLYCDNSGLS